MAPHRHLIVDLTVTSARTNTNVPRIGARLPLRGSLALGAQHGKLDADLRTFALLGTPSIQSIHDYCPFAMEDGSRLAPVTVELVDRLAVLVAEFVASVAWVLLTLAPCAMTVMSVCIISFVDLLMFLFGVFGGMCDVNSCNVFLLLFMARWVPISATLFRRAVLTLWYPFLFLGLKFFPLFFFLFGGLQCFFF
jgi:hypothetical protein